MARRLVGEFMFVSVGFTLGAWVGMTCTATIEGESMMPTLLPRDRVLLIPRWARRQRSMHSTLLGRVVLVKVTQQTLCKRVRDCGATCVDLQEKHFSSTLAEELEQRPAEQPRTAADDDCSWLWVEGDNAAVSYDSRSFGALPYDSLQGVVVAVIWPLSRLHIVGTQTTKGI